MMRASRRPIILADASPISCKPSAESFRRVMIAHILPEHIAPCENRLSVTVKRGGDATHSHEGSMRIFLWRGLAAIFGPGYGDAAACEFLASFLASSAVTLVEPRGIESSLGRSDKDIEAWPAPSINGWGAENSCPRQSNARSRSCRL